MEKENKLCQSLLTSAVCSDNNNSLNEFSQEIEQEFDVKVKVEPSDYEMKLENINLVTDILIKKDLYKDTEIKEELNTAEGPENIQETDENHYLEKDLVIKEEKDLYEDHVVKDELVIGPEIIHKTVPNETINYRKSELNIEFICAICSNSFSQEGELKRHMRICSKYVCDICQNGFDSHSEITEHLANHIKESPEKKPERLDSDFYNQICKVCNKKFHRKQSLLRHMRTHDKCNADNICHICSKDYATPQNLVRHMIVHSDKKPYACIHCDKRFTRKDYLKKHIEKIHSVDALVAPIKASNHCKFCNKGFANGHNRRFHEKYSCPKNMNRKKKPRIIKQYTCDICSKSYPYRSSLTAHITLFHMGLRSTSLFECDFCGKRYMKKFNLQTHIHCTHMGKGRVYKCHKCDIEYAWYSALVQHKKTKHGKVKTKVVELDI